MAVEPEFESFAERQKWAQGRLEEKARIRRENESREEPVFEGVAKNKKKTKFPEELDTLPDVSQDLLPEPEIEASVELPSMNMVLGDLADTEGLAHRVSTSIAGLPDNRELLDLVKEILSKVNAISDKMAVNDTSTSTWG